MHSKCVSFVSIVYQESYSIWGERHKTSIKMQYSYSGFENVIVYYQHMIVLE